MMKFVNMRTAMAVIFLLGMSVPPAVHAAEKDGDVTLLEDKNSFTLSNGIVTARILKSNGDIRSLLYKGTELLTDQSGHPGGYWSHDTTGGADLVTHVTIDPTDNGGERAEACTAVERARTVYELHGAGGTLELREPWDYTRLPTSTQDAIIDWMKRTLK
ncbi:MAG: hypothetical protein JW828_15945 [Sedimentisphaerales bacterium]|nr:hypothetical protein [Sedimentisphaerales bacterium]